MVSRQASSMNQDVPGRRGRRAGVAIARHHVTVMDAGAALRPAGLKSIRARGEFAALSTAGQEPLVGIWVSKHGGRMGGYLKPALTFLIFSLLAVTASPALAAEKASKPIPAPSFTLPGQRSQVSIDSLRGRVVFVDFWASWCEPCRKSFPWMKTLMQQYGSRGFTVLAVSLDKSRDDADAFIDRYGPNFPIAYDFTGKVAESYAVKAMPSSFLVNRAGQIVYSHPGFNPRETAAVESLIVGTCAQ